MSRRRYGRRGELVHSRVSASPRSFQPLSPFFSSPPLTLFEDRRTFHPGRATRPAFSFNKAASRLVVGAPSFRNDLSARVGFAVPSKVAVCIRRKDRKEVLHAFNFYGRGAGGVSRRRRRSRFSDVDC